MRAERPEGDVASSREHTTATAVFGSVTPDEPGLLYRTMCLIRYVEQAVAELWNAGLVSGEMHLGAGEEAAVVGVLAHLREGDALSVDYRSTPAFVARGVPVEALLREVLGDERGLDGGRGGHLHLLSPDHLAASTGIVGGTAPVAVGFGLAAQLEGRQQVAVAFFGDGAVNEGMVMESLNLARVWRLPVVFVCKDNGWAVTTRTQGMTAGGLRRRVRGFGLPYARVDGSDVTAVSRTAARAVARARLGGGPSFLVADVARLEGHFLGDALMRAAGDWHEATEQARPLLRAAARGPGAHRTERLRALARIGAGMGVAALDRTRARRDPLAVAGRRLPADEAARLEQEAWDEVRVALRAVRPVTPGGRGSGTAHA